MSPKFGYVRVSTKEQSIGLQVDALEAAGCDKIYIDEGVSGSLKHRPDFDRLLKDIPSGATLSTWKLDRIGRSLKHLIEFNDDLKARGIYFESLTENIDTSALIGELVFQILGAVGQFELGLIRERTIAGMEAAADEGKYPGRPRSLTNSQIIYALEQIEAGRSFKAVAGQLKTSTETVRRRIAEFTPCIAVKYIDLKCEVAV
ncbi:MAG: recombinase family protein [Emcibacteraceae bacterium]|nr:recombinase family protein [Emcibacteraceae bacterium]